MKQGRTLPNTGNDMFYDALHVVRVTELFFLSDPTFVNDVQRNYMERTTTPLPHLPRMLLSLQ